ncbi:MAG: alpha/beta hydrolase [Promethearchaeota archaeon]|nr:MAG: alpha/beta hydrolase [Candidatus Lokiarchaeota archaeon]
MNKDKDRKFKEKYGIETGYFKNGVPFARFGQGSEIIINIEALTYNHAPPTGFELKQFIKSTEVFAKDYMVYNIGRKPNLPQGYYMDKMADDYAQVIKEELKKPVIVMGTSTGGQIAHFVCANYPGLVEKLILISTAYRISKEGETIERKSAEYFEKKQYGKYLSTLMDLIFNHGIKRTLIKGFIRLLGKLLVRDVEYPNDYLVEVEADREMNFKDRLHEIKAPTLILSGVRDVCYGIEDVRDTANGIPNAKLITYNNFGHNLMMANRDEIQKEILAFLRN